MTPSFWVVDTNVVVSAIITSDAASPAAVILNHMLNAEFNFALSLDLLSEYRRVLLRPRIKRLHGLTEREIDILLEVLATNGVIVDTSGRNEQAPEPGDNHLWRLLAARPGLNLITGDALLIENPPPGRRVLRPREFIGSRL